jgi:uncharacterized protein YbbC (DUF1343 family)
MLQVSCTEAQPETPTKIMVGAAQFQTYLPLLTGKRIALLVNQTSMVDNTHLVDTLLSINEAQDLGISIDKVFAPEHGFRGQADAGEKVSNGIDPHTGIPITSLYGNNRKPTPEQLEGLDWVIFDIQDVGVRFYTYISSMHYLMEACAENGVKMMVLDRPNPNGMYVDGPVLDMAQQSFVGMHPIPIVHGLTVGEFAQMINGEQWLDSAANCDLTVINMENYTHKMTYSLPVKPSPNLPNDLSIALYPSICLFEGTDISLGRGTYAPFQHIGHPDFASVSSYSFTPTSIEGMSKYPKHQDKECFGIDFSTVPPTYGFSLKHLIDYYHQYEVKEQYFNDYFKKLAGNDKLSQQIKDGLSEQEIRATWEVDLQNYKQVRKKYLLYADFE